MPMTTLTPVDAFSEPVQVEANGTTITKEGIGDLGLQRLADQATFLKNRLPGTDVAVPVVFNPPAHDDIAGEWGSATSGVMLQLQVGTTSRTFRWTPPVKGTLTRIDAVVFGSYSSATHAGGLPGTMPRIHAYASDASDATVVDLGDATDTAADVAAYEVAHLISKTGLTQDLEDQVINVVVTGEDGGNALNNSFALIALKFWVTP